MEFMDEKPKSIWKKSWKGCGAFLGWLVLATGLAFVVSLLGIIILDPWQWRADGGIVIVGTAGGAITALLFLFIRWLFYQRNLRRTLFGLACLITLISLVYAEEDWRGWHAWQIFKQEWEAKGERFDFASVVPPPVPDEQNFALTPIVASSYLFILDKNGHRISPLNTNVVNRLNMTAVHNNAGPTNGTGNWQQFTMSDLSVWQNYYRALAVQTNEFSVPSQPQSPAADVLQALSKYDSGIEELREASRLPSSRFPLNYDSESPSAILLPHLTALRTCSQTLQLRCLAELQNGQPEKAIADVKLALQLADKIHTEPFLISHLVRIRMVNLTLQPIYEGLAEHKWSDAQLVELDAELAKLDFLADYKLSMRGEMGCQGGEADRLRRHPEQLEGLNGMNDGEGGVINQLLPGKLVVHLIPTGWFYQNQLRCARVMVDYYLPVADVNRGTVSPAEFRRGNAALFAETKTATPFNMLERLMLPALGVVRKFACGQESVDLARVAIALERYRLAHGEYPKSLDVLAPQFIAKLPHDVINDQPLHYHRTSDPSSQRSDAASGQFVLYSVGWNETDDGGVVSLTKKGYLDISTGDWVWRYPAR
jgi:tetratricopeptide (TPR) repeat protein